MLIIPLTKLPDFKPNDSEKHLCPSNMPPIPSNPNDRNPIIPYKKSLQSPQSDTVCTPQTACKDTSQKLNPALMAQTLLRDNKIIMYKKAVYIWDYNCYRLLSQIDLIRICNRKFMTEISDAGSYHILKAIAQFVVSQVEDCNLTEDTSGFIVFQNGILLLENNSFFGIHHWLSDYLVLHALKVSYSGGQCPIFNAYLNNIAGGEQWLVKRLWQTLGLLLSSDVKAKRVVVLVGTGGSWKSTFGNIVREFFHEDNVTSFSPKALLDRFAGSALVNSAVNIYMDLPSLPFDADVVARIKGLSGGDCIEGEIKYMSNFSYIYKGHLLFGSNHPIRLTYPDEAFFERLLLIPCNYKVPQNARDPRLIEKIRPELSAIATTAALFFSEVRNNGYHFEGDNIVKNDMSALFAVETPNNDDIIQRFIQERCRIIDSQEVYTPIRDLFEEYGLFCRQYQHVNLYSANTFSKALSSLLPNSKTTKKRIGKDTINCRTCIIIKEKENNLT